MEDKTNNEVRRIFLKLIVLKIIKDRPTHGYDIIKTIEQRSDGRWAPSAGSVYPILESLERNGIIRSEEIERRKVYSITPKGELGLEQMLAKKRQLLVEMTRAIDFATGEAGENERGR
ncbi:MAG TPA: PadR family transcriptional regulator [Methanocella sp.]|uniref:PadR family transcriptional regulator n=1 Tax=Methanocella sp. TaxID=2052833 RepID=UPI002BDF2B4E|nr:PadR family transcriptional regulator [Methanocella sp.]HTY90682.1 PadR family transcriptional regulator [Methanocella sp.]